MVYDVTNERSFENVFSWLSEVERAAGPIANKLLIGNKCDLTSRRVVSFERGQDFAREHGMHFIETSAKTNTNVELAFLEIAHSARALRLAEQPRNDHLIRTTL